MRSLSLTRFLLPALLLGIAYVPARAQCSATGGTITVTLEQVDQGQFAYEWTVTNAENGNGNRVLDVFFEIETADTANTSAAIAQWARTKGLVDATWNALQFNHTGGTSICSGGGSCGSVTETYNYTLSQFINSIRVRVVQANGHTENFNDFTSAGNCTLLPVELATFDATLSGNHAMLEWTTSSEVDVAGFDVQYKVASEFHTRAFVPAIGKPDGTDYHFELDLDGIVAEAVRLKLIDLDGSFTYSDAVELAAVPTGGFAISSTYPNPFNPSTQFELAVARDQHVQVVVHDILGRQVATLYDGLLIAQQSQTLVFDASDLPSGIYVIRTAGDHFTTSRLVTLLK